MHRRKSVDDSALPGPIDQSEADLFREAMSDVTPLRYEKRVESNPKSQPAIPRQKIADELQVLSDSLSDALDDDALLDTDASLSYRTNGIGPNTLRKLRSGAWTVQAELDLHGLRVADAKAQLLLFLHTTHQQRMRCVRIIHGKGLGSKNKQPILKAKVRHWLTHCKEVLAYTQARPTDGGSGAVIVLLRGQVHSK